MKKILLSLFAVLALCLGLSAAAHADEDNKGKLDITTVRYNAKGADTLANRWQESIFLRNTTEAELNISGWKVHDSYKNPEGDFTNSYTFPANTVVPAGEYVQVTPAGPKHVSGKVHYMGFTRGYHGHFLNNGGDTVTVRDDDGDKVDELSYDFDNGYYVR